MAPLTAGEVAVGLLVRQAVTDRDQATANAGFLLDRCVEDLTVVQAMTARIGRAADIRAQRPRAAEEIRAIRATMRACAAAISGGRATAGTVAGLRTAVVRLRFIRPAAPTLDSADTGNPLYNITIWLLDVISDCGTILHAQRVLDTAACCGVTDSMRSARLDLHRTVSVDLSVAVRPV